MEIKRHLATDGTFCPEAVNILGQLPASALFHRQHQLRHAQSLYALSLDRVAEQFLRVSNACLAKTNEYQTDVQMIDVQELLQQQDSFLRSLQEHLDDCYLILTTLINPVAQRKDSRFAKEFVIASKLPGAKSFQQVTADYGHYES